MWRVGVWPQHRLADIHDLLEARYHLLQAEDFTAAGELSEAIVSRLDTQGAWDQATAVARDTVGWLPADSDRRGSWVDMLGYLAEKRGDHRQAGILYRQALAIREALAAAAPDNPEYRRDLSVTYDRLGALAPPAGPTGQAPARHHQALATHERRAGK